MKKCILLFAATIAAVSVKAQTGYNYYPFGVAADISYMHGYTHVPRQDDNVGLNFSFIYNYNPYLPVAIEVQKGKLSGGGLTVDKDKYGRQFTNNFLAVYLHADIHLGSFINYGESSFLNGLKNLYFGSGIGFVSNNNKVQRYNIIAQNGTIGAPFAGKDKSVNYAVPLRVGYEFKIFNSYDQPGSAIDIGYVHNIVFGDGLDGYTDTRIGSKGTVINQYRELTIGFKYFFGTVVPYKKLIRP